MKKFLGRMSQALHTLGDSLDLIHRFGKIPEVVLLSKEIDDLKRVNWELRRFLDDANEEVDSLRFNGPTLFRNEADALSGFAAGHQDAAAEAVRNLLRRCDILPTDSSSVDVQPPACPVELLINDWDVTIEQHNIAAPLWDNIQALFPDIPPPEMKLTPHHLIFAWKDEVDSVTVCIGNTGSAAWATIRSSGEIHDPYDLDALLLEALGAHESRSSAKL